VKNRHTKLVLFCCLQLLLSAPLLSQDTDKNIYYEHPTYSFPYHLDKPDQTWELPKKLVEISGLSLIDKNRLACVQDEKGNIYIYNLQVGDIEKKIDFGDDGDYEGIEIIGDDAWILKSNGTLYRAKNFLKKDEPETKKYNTDLSGKNDTEGLGYDPLSKNLLIACKGHPFTDDKKGKEYKAIYRFHSESKKLNKHPYLLIVLDSVKSHKDYNTMAKLGVELLATLDHSKGDVSFQPSGIAIHPISGKMYVLASSGNVLVVFSESGKMLAMVKLISKLYAQPEGICFDKDGTMYISNEGDGGAGTILKFNLKK